MNRNGPIEKHLLTRSYSDEAMVQQLLESRYSITGDQKPHLVLLATQGKTSHEATKSLLHVEKPNSTKITKRAHNTRRELKEYVSRTLKNQKKIAKKIQNTKATDKPLEVEKLLERFDVPKFEEFLHLNALWKDYMLDLLNIANGKIPSLPNILPKLSTADYNGCYLTVVKSTNYSLVGVCGIVVWDFQHSFIIVVPRCDGWKRETGCNDLSYSGSEQVGGLRMIPKKGTQFEFSIETDEERNEGITFDIIGSRFEFRSSDRSGKKFKNHNVDDL